MNLIRIAIAEDEPLSIKSLLRKLEADPGISVSVIALNGKELIDALQERPIVDLILMDIKMPEVNGIETTRLVKALYPQMKVIMLTVFDDDDKIFDAIMAGASGYLLKDDSDDKITGAVRDAMNGGAAMSPTIALKVLNLVRQPLTNTQPVTDFGLTKREIELLEQLKSGRSYEQAANNMCISVGTVQRHIANIYGKLQVNNKVEAVQKATMHRLV